MEVARHDDRGEAPPCEGQLLSGFEIEGERLDEAVASEVFEARDVAIDGRYRVAPISEESRVATGAAGEVENPAPGLDERREALDPRRRRLARRTLGAGRRSGVPGS